VAGLLIVKTGDAPPAIAAAHGDFDTWFRAAIGRQADLRQVHRGEPLPDPDDPLGVIVTGSPAMVSWRERWSERTAAWLGALMSAGRVPVLGVCYGHQLLAHARGGEVGPNPRGRQMGTAQLRLTRAGHGDALLGPLAANPVAQTTHEECVLQPPRDAVHLASTATDRYHALRFTRRAWGVQFHPEFDPAIMRAYVKHRREPLQHEGFDADAMQARVVPARRAYALLAAFADYCETLHQPLSRAVG